MVQVRGPSDSGLIAVVRALDEYLAKHAGADLVVYRHDSVSIRIRIIDPDFAPVSRIQRHQSILPYLRKLPDELLSDVTVILLLAPNESDDSLANMEFENPVEAFS